MSCCGQARLQALRDGTLPPRAIPSPGMAERAVMPPPAAGGAGMAAMPTMQGRAVLAGEVKLRYLGQAPVRVTGPVSGRQYLFSAAQHQLPVAAQDAPALLATVHFRRAT